MDFRVIDEAIRCRLAVADALEIFASEDIAAGSVTAHGGATELTLAIGGDHKSDAGAVSAWIEPVVNVNQLSQQASRP